ncbi:phosphotransferase [Arthrobacter tumbae]|uniref:phosphotransferase n=1 Tax=Arthrobacter tumbae TaxID=163874 RepID=UPI001EF8E05C|nr:phosphotransferase [Arthrobacter tumbae]MBM7780544.1 hypothetical protein [Arthrobacter tumbae]
MSWDLAATKVLHVRARGEDFVVKAAPPEHHHINREITAHETFTEALVRSNRTSQLVAAHRAANLLITTYQPGTLVEGTPYELDLGVHAQAGSVLRAFHEQSALISDEYELRATDKTVAWLDKEHRIASTVEAEVRQILAAYRPAPIMIVPTHGDWQPRNWLMEDGDIRVIDFGRFDLRPPATDLCRLAAQQWKEAPGLEAAFLDGYGSDPRRGVIWVMELLREAVGTAVWAYQMGDTDFEAQGHRMLEEAITHF